MKLLTLAFLFSGVFMQSACTSAPAGNMMSAVATSAAVISVPSTVTTAYISNAISRALHGTKVTVAPDAFIKSSQLTLERSTQNARSMPSLNGRLMGVPVIHRFSLMKRGGSCYLIYEKTGKELPLHGVSCEPVS